MMPFNWKFFSSLFLLLSLMTSVLAQTAAFDTTRIDASADACTDFFQYANGKWVKNTEIPAAYSRWGTFNILLDNNQSVLKGILENAEKTKSAKNSEAQLI